MYSDQFTTATAYLVCAVICHSNVSIDSIQFGWPRRRCCYPRVVYFELSV